MGLKNLFFLFLATLFLSGCISLEIYQEVDKDGSSRIEMLYDLSAMMDMGSTMFEDEFDMNESLDSNFTFESEQIQTEEDTQLSEDTFCEDSNFDSGTLVECEVISEGVYRVVVDIDVSDYFTVSQGLISTNYEFDATSIFEVLDDANDDNSTQDPGFSELSTMGATFTYEISLPGEIVSYEHGTLNGENVIINLADIESVNESIVTSQERNYILIFVIVAVIVLILVAILTSFMLNRNKSKPKEDISSLSPEENQCRQYILQYKNSFGRDAIKTSLIHSGVRENKVEEYLEKYY